MDIEIQIEKTRELVENGQLSPDMQLILENQLVILKTLKKLDDNTTKRDRSYFGPG